MQIAETRNQIDAAVDRLRGRLDHPPRRQSGRSPFAAARAEIERIRKGYQRKINTSWHPIHSQAGIEAELDDAVQAALDVIAQLEESAADKA